MLPTWAGATSSSRRRSAAALGQPVYVANDANIAVLGEFTFGGGAEGGLMLLRLSTGVGAGLVLGGTLLHGHGGAAGEIGHVQVDARRRGRAPAGAAAASRPSWRCPGCAAGSPPESADRVLDDAAHQLATALAPVVATLNLGELVLSGPLDLVEPLARISAPLIRDRVMPVTAEQFVVRATTLGDDGVLVGATGLVLAAELGVS